MARPIGKRGSWFAAWQGEDLPCFHSNRRCGAKSLDYCDRYVDGRGEWSRYVDALKAGRAIERKTKLGKDGETPPSAESVDYIDVWKITGVEVEEGILRFRLVARENHLFT